MGLSSTRIGEPMRRDRLLLISAFATALLTLLGAVGESLGMDRLLKSNTSKVWTHSLFRQGCMLYELITQHARVPALAFDGEIRRRRVQRRRSSARYRILKMRGWLRLEGTKMRSLFIIPRSRENSKIEVAQAPHLGHFVGIGLPDFRVNRVY
jgi:hypothetical protein